MPGDEAEAYGAHAGFWDHGGVLRNYLVAGAGIFVALAVAVFAFGADAIIHCLLKPLEGQTLLFLQPGEQTPVVAENLSTEMCQIYRDIGIFAAREPAC